MLIIGELINSTRKQVRTAIEEQDAALIQRLARDQAAAGANWIDVNAGAFPTDEVERLRWLVTTIRGVTTAPLSIISAESERYAALIPLVKKHAARVVALSLDDRGMTEDMETVWQVADGLVKRLEDDGVPPDHIFVDPLVRPVSTNGEYAMGALRVVEKLTVTHPLVHKTCGLSNVSYGLPKRRLVNQVFVAMAIARGMDSAIIDPLDPRMMASIAAAEALAGRDQFCMGYITAEREGRLAGMG